MKALTPARERRLLKSFGRASLSSPWWKMQVSDFKHCFRCGGALRRRYVPMEGRTRSLCAACGTITYQNPKIVAGVLPVKDGRVTLLRRAIEPARGLWTFPAGFMELGETVEQAALRETREEICCRVRLEGLQGIYSYEDAVTVIVVYRARLARAVPRPGRESLEVRSFRPAEIPWEKLAFRNTFQALKEWAG